MSADPEGFFGRECPPCQKRSPNEQAAMAVLYLVATTRRKDRETLTGKTNGWQAISNPLTVHCGDRIAVTMTAITVVSAKLPRVKKSALSSGRPKGRFSWIRY